MDIVTKLHDLINDYDCNCQCDFCWEFTYARKDYANLKPFKDGKCCVHFILTDFTESENWVADEVSSELTYVDHSFTAFVGSMSRLDLGVYNEMEKHPECEGKYLTHVQPVLECLRSFEEDICSGFDWVGKKTKTPKYNYGDANLDGIILKGTLRERLI